MKLGVIYIILGAWIVFLAISMLAGCKTKSVLQIREVHDTLITQRTDTIRMDVLSNSGHSDYQSVFEKSIVKDTERVDTEKRIVLNNLGDTIRIEVDRKHYRHTSEKDSSSFYRHVSDSLASVVLVYKSKCDSLQSVVDKRDEREAVYEKRSWMETFKVVVVMALCIGVLLIFLKNYNNMNDWMKK